MGIFGRKEPALRTGSIVELKNGYAVLASGHVKSFNSESMFIEVTWSGTSLYKANCLYSVERNGLWKVVREDSW